MNAVLVKLLNAFGYPAELHNLGHGSVLADFDSVEAERWRFCVDFRAVIPLRMCR